MSGLIRYPNCSITLKVFLNKFFEKVDFEKKPADNNKSMQNYPEGKELRNFLVKALQAFKTGYQISTIIHIYAYSLNSTDLKFDFELAGILNY